MTDAIVPRAPRIRKTRVLATAAIGGIVLAAIFMFNAAHMSERDRIAAPAPTSAPQGQRERRKTPPPQQQKDDAAVREREPRADPLIKPNVAAPSTTGLGKARLAKGSRPETGRASWYDLDSPTASGETIDDDDLTAAHPTLPLGTHVLVDNLDNGQSVVVRINDRGPFTQNRIIDLSKAAAAKLGMVASGVATVRVSRVESALASDTPTTP